MAHHRRFILSFLATAALLGSTPASAQEPGPDRDALRRELRLPRAPTVELAARGPRAAPAVSLGVPTAFGADFGDAFIGAGFQARTRFADRMDGGVVAGIGLGDARRLVGFEVALTSFGTARSCCRGGVSFKVHRLLPGDAAVAVGWENAAGWGEVPDGDGTGPFTDGGSSGYAAASKVFHLRPGRADPFSTLTVTLGAGSGRFRSESDVLAEEETINAFGSLGLRVAEPASVVASWTGQDLNAGVSVVPLPRTPLVATLGLADLTTRPRFVLGVGFGFGFSDFF